MLSGRQLILATRPFAKEVRWKSWYYVISTFLLLCLCLTSTLLNFPILIKILLSFFAALLIVRMFAIYHDYVHEAILCNSILAKTVFTAFGLYVLAPISIWRLSHDHHHHHNSKLSHTSIGSYPVFTKSKFEKSSLNEKRHYLFIRHPLTIGFGYIFTFLHGMCIQSLQHNFKKHLDSLLALIFHFVGQILLICFFGWQAFLFFSLIPHLVSGCIGSYLFYVQHNFPGVIFKVNNEWTYEGAALESSSYLEVNAFLRWVTANIGYHHIHHLNPRIPFYRLQEVMGHYKELQAPKKSTFMPLDIAACLKLKVWDNEKKQMVGLT